MLNKYSQSSRKGSCAECLCLFYEGEKMICHSTLRLGFLDGAHTHTKRRILKISQNPHDFTNNLPAIHSCKIHHTDFKHTSCQATSYTLTFFFLIFQDTVRSPPEALLTRRAWLCFPSLSTSWSHWGFGTCNWGSQPSFWEVLLTRGPRRAEQLCRLSVTTVPEPRERNTNS